MKIGSGENARAIQAKKQPELSRGCFPYASQSRFLGSSDEGVRKYLIDFIGERGGNRTRDPLIKSQVLCRLSYALSKKEGYWSSR
jgi:hypothetical protein